MRRFLVLAVIPFVVACDKILLGKDDPVVSIEENVQPPPALNDGWNVSDLAAQNIHPESVVGLIGTLQNSPGNVHSLLIVRNNKLVSESYFDGWHRERLHALRSASKSFMSTMMGIAIDQGYVSDVNQRVFNYFPEYSALDDPQKDQIKIQNLLTMTTGFQWDEKTFPADDYRNDEYAFDRSEDRIDFILQRPCSTPGNNFVYCSAAPVLLAAIIRKSTGEEPDVFGDRNLFNPLGIVNYYWRKEADGLPSAVGPLFLRPRDMAKLGQLFLDSGKWKGQQIVSSDWVAAASATFIGDERTANGYGYNWWTASYTINQKATRIYSARGTGGQYIFVIPDLNSVIVFTGGNYETDQTAVVGMMVNIILPQMF